MANWPALNMAVGNWYSCFEANPSKNPAAAANVNSQIITKVVALSVTCEARLPHSMGCTIGQFGPNIAIASVCMRRRILWYGDPRVLFLRGRCRVREHERKSQICHSTPNDPHRTALPQAWLRLRLATEQRGKAPQITSKHSDCYPQVSKTDQDWSMTVSSMSTNNRGLRLEKTIYS